MRLQRQTMIGVIMGIIGIVLVGIAAYLFVKKSNQGTLTITNTTIPNSTILDNTVKSNVIGPGSTADECVRYWGQYYKVPVALIKAVISVESSWNPYAKNPTDPSYGLMGVKPENFYDAGLCKDWRNPTQAEINTFYTPYFNIKAGTRYLSLCYSKGYPNIDAIAQSYNVGIRGYWELGYRNQTYANKIYMYYNQYVNEA